MLFWAGVLAIPLWNRTIIPSSFAMALILVSTEYNEFGILAMDNEFQTPQILAAILKKAQALRVSSASGEIDAYMGQFSLR
jgi:hypothetical protein